MPKRTHALREKHPPQSNRPSSKRISQGWRNFIIWNIKVGRVILKKGVGRGKVLSQSWGGKSGLRSNKKKKISEREGKSEKMGQGKKVCTPKLENKEQFS